MAERVMLADNKPITDELLQRHLDEVGFLLGQPKIDGMRVYIGPDRIPQTRSGKEWKHKPLRAWALDHPSLRGLDGEVVPGHVYRPDSFREAMSGLRAEEGTREFTFYVFDDTTDEAANYLARMQRLADLVGAKELFQESEAYHAQIILCPTYELRTLGAVQDFEAGMVEAGWEGAMLRRPDLPYKFGRSTNRGGQLIKMKRFEDAEAIVVGYEPWKQNNNESTVSSLGYATKSSHQDGKVPLEMLGALHVELTTDRRVKFDIGVMQGVTHSERRRLWETRDTLIGRICKFKHAGYGGGYDVPRQPVFLNWRSALEF